MSDSPSSRPRVLLVDDDPSVLDTLGALLEEDFEITTAHDGPTALALAERTSFDVVCTDERMPGMSGTQLLRELRDRGQKLGAVVVTGLVDSSAITERPRAPDGTPVRIVLKPYDPDILMAAIANAVQLVRERRGFPRADPPEGSAP